MAKGPRKQQGLSPEEVAKLSPAAQAQIKEQIPEPPPKPAPPPKAAAPTPAPATLAPSQQAEQKPADQKSAGDVVTDSLKNAALSFGNKMFDAAFPQFKQKDKDDDNKNLSGVTRALIDLNETSQVIADRVDATNNLLTTSIARQEMTNSLLKDLLKEVAAFHKDGMQGGNQQQGGGLIGDALDMLGGGGGAAKTAETAGKVAPKAGILGKGLGFLNKIKGGLGGLLGGLALDYASNKLTESGHEKIGAAAGIGGDALTFGGTGAMLGSVVPGIGTAIGGGLGALAGGAYGLYKNWGNLFGGSKDSETPEEDTNKSAAIQQLQQQGTGDLNNITLTAKSLVFNADNIMFNARNQTGGAGGAAGITGAAGGGPVVAANQGPTTPSQMPSPTTPSQMPSPTTPSAAAPGATAAVSPGVTTGDNAQILATIKKRESGGNYQAKAGSSSASGAYQFTDGTWQSLTKKYGIGAEYKSARDAPPQIQDQVAGAYVKEILQKNNGDVSKIPNVWYTGNAQGNMSAKALAANKGLTAASYQSSWMKDYDKIGTQMASQQQQQPSSQSSSFTEQTASLNQNPQQNANAPGMRIGTGAGPTRADTSGAGQKGTPGQTGQNGMLDRGSLTQIAPGQFLQPEAAKAWMAMRDAASQEGITWGVTDSYRDYNTQVKLAREKGLYSQGGLAATPGKSNHGLGLATDLKLSDKAFAWLQQNAGKFGFKNIPREKWHWEYKGGGDATLIAKGDKQDSGKSAGAEGGPQSASATGTSVASDTKPKTAMASQAAPTASPVASSPSKGADLNQASTKDVVDQRSAKTAVTVNQQSAKIEKTKANNTEGKYGPDDVGIVEPADAKKRLAELFHVGMGVA
jgi:LAS superfamily LD-carboxypeptidase LdcB